MVTDIRWATAEAEAKPSEKLSPGGDVVAVLGAKSNTALRTLWMSCKKGLLEFRRGRAVIVARGAYQGSVVVPKAHELVKIVRSQGCRREELIRIN